MENRDECSSFFYFARILHGSHSQVERNLPFASQQIRNDDVLIIFQFRDLSVMTSMFTLSLTDEIFYRY